MNVSMLRSNYLGDKMFHLRPLQLALHLVIAYSNQFNNIKSPSLEWSSRATVSKSILSVQTARPSEMFQASQCVRWKAQYPSITPNRRKCALVHWVFVEKTKNIKSIYKRYALSRSKGQALSQRSTRKNQSDISKNLPLAYLDERWNKELA